MYSFTKYAVILFFSLTCNTILPVTLVYNMRVRRAFNVPQVLKQDKARYLLSSVPIGFWRESCITQEGLDAGISESRKAGGALFNLRYVPSKNWWLDVTTGIEKDSATYTGAQNFSGSRTGFDDIVLTGGYRAFLSKRAQVVGYGLVGLPTHRNVTLEDRFGPFVGSRFFNIGVGAEASYSFINELKKSFSFIAQGRFIHGFKRSWFPILPPNAKIEPGNFTDILFALQYRDRFRVYQAGYDLTLFSNQAIDLPGARIEANSFIRNSWYATAGQAILNGFFEKPTIFGAGVSASISKQFNARTAIGWLFIMQVF